MKLLPCLFACLLLASCASPEVVYTPQPVNVAVPVPCHVDPIKPPIWPTSLISKKAPMFEKARALLSENKLRRAYEAKLIAAVNSCQ